MKKILFSLMTVALVVGLVGAGAFAYFSDTETSAGNTFTAGTLDLEVDGQNPLTATKFTVTNMRPGNQPKGKYKLENIGTLDGYIDLENVTVTSYENIRTEAEVEAGDPTAGDPGMGNGELQNVVNLRLFVDYGGDGWISTGDVVFYNGLVSALPSNFDLNEPLNAGTTTYIVALFDWWSTPNDNQAQSDSMDIDITFELAQTAGQ